MTAWPPMLVYFPIGFKQLLAHRRYCPHTSFSVSSLHGAAAGHGTLWSLPLRGLLPPRRCHGLLGLPVLVVPAASSAANLDDVRPIVDIARKPARHLSPYGRRTRVASTI